MSESRGTPTAAPVRGRRSLWITWHDHQRTRSLVRELGVPLFVRDRQRPLSRHVGGLFWACRMLAREKPDLVLLHHSYALLLACVLYKAGRRGRVRIVADCHNKALKRRVQGPLSPLFQRLKRRLFRSVDLLVVTNERLRPYAIAYGPAVAVLRDPLPAWGGSGAPPAPSGGAPAAGGPYVLFVCSFDRDEPVDAIFAAALGIVRELDLDVVVSGDYRKVAVPADIAREPRIRLPGFMPKALYQACLAQAAVVVVLTDDDDCLVCGAYEAVGAAKPLVVTDTAVLREVFAEGAVYAGNEAAAIVDAVAQARAQTGQGPTAARQRFLVDFAREWEAFKARLDALR